MDISQAHTEAFAQFLEFHDTFNQQFKAVVSALQYVAEGTDGAGDTKGFLACMEKSWRDGHNWSDAREILRIAVNDSCRLAIVQLHSALDNFLTAVDAEHTRWRDFTKASSPTPVVAQGDADEPLWKICARLGLDPSGVLKLGPLLSLFRVMRNCIAHRSGRASTKLATLSTSSELVELLKTWPKRASGRPPRILEIRDGRPITVQPKTVILCLDVIRRACAEVNLSLVQYLGVAGISYGAAFTLFLDDERETLPIAYRKPNRGINQVLATRYYVRFPKSEAMEELQRLGVWAKCVRRHAKLYRQSVERGVFKPPKGKSPVS